MKTISPSRILAFLLTASNANCQTSPFTVSLNIQPPPYYQGANYDISILDGSFGADLLLSLNNTGVLQPVNGTAGISHVWFSTNSNSVFDFTYVKTQPVFFDLSKFSIKGQIETTLDVPFYLSFWLGGSNSASASTGVYGWSQLKRNDTGLVLTDSYIEPTGKGIIVGTTTAVPEPSTFLLMGLGCVAVFGLRKRAQAKFR